MKLCEKIKEIREKAGKNQKEFADIVGCTPEYISLIEKRPNNETIASEKILSKIAEKFTKSEQERKLLERDLLFLRLKTKNPAVAEHLIEGGNEGKYTVKESMSQAFLNRLSKDLVKIKNRKSLYNKLKIVKKEVLEKAEKGDILLSRAGVIELADALNQPRSDYLLLAEYAPREILGLLRNRKFDDFCRAMSYLSPEDQDEMFDIYLSVLRTHRKKK